MATWYRMTRKRRGYKTRPVSDPMEMEEERENKDAQRYIYYNLSFPILIYICLICEIDPNFNEMREK